MAGNDKVFQESMSKGHSAAWDQQWEKAAAAYQKALEEFPHDAKALTSLGLALYESQEFDKALLAYQKAALEAPNDPVPAEKVGLLSERVGKKKEAVQALMRASELYIRNQNSKKALENWGRITQIDPEFIPARQYLAIVHERLDHKSQATSEYLATASLYQRSGNATKASEMIGRALHLSPRNAEARQAENMLKNGQLLPRPLHPHGGTGALRMVQVKQIEPPKTADTGMDPVAEAQKQALSRLAEMLFDLSEEVGSSALPSKRGMQAIMRGTGELDIKQSERGKIMQYISAAVDAQTKNRGDQAAEELEGAMAAGFTDPALYFDLGQLRFNSEEHENALRHLQIAVKHKDYAIGSRLLMGQILQKLGRTPEAAIEYMEALKLADSEVVPPEHSAEIRQLYEPMIEGQSQQTDMEKLDQICENIRQILLRPNWRSQVLQAREQLPKSADGLLPLAEILIQAQSSQVIDAVGKVRQLARGGYLRSAMDEAYDSLDIAPTYLPLHTLMGDLLVQEGRTEDAIEKFSVVAEAYGVRGEAAQAIGLLRRIVQLSPMDLSARSKLIDQLAARGLVDEAIGEYLDLADIYYRLAELDMARKTYTTALRLAQQGGANREWSVKLLQRMADIDMQHLDWRQALRVFEQIRSLEPDDISVRKNLIELNLRLSQQPQANAELENFLTHLEGSGHRSKIIPFLEELVQENPKSILLHRSLAEEYRLAKRIPEAVAQLDTIGENMLNSGDRDGAIQVIEAIIAMNPPNQAKYQTLLTKVRTGS
jgi:tetratricopeptide (TPR) repeat protein